MQTNGFTARHAYLIQSVISAALTVGNTKFLYSKVAVFSIILTAVLDLIYRAVLIIL